MLTAEDKATSAIRSSCTSTRAVLLPGVRIGRLRADGGGIGDGLRCGVRRGGRHDADRHRCADSDGTHCAGHELPCLGSAGGHRAARSIRRIEREPGRERVDDGRVLDVGGTGVERGEGVADDTARGEPGGVGDFEQAQVRLLDDVHRHRCRGRRVALRVRGGLRDRSGGVDELFAFSADADDPVDGDRDGGAGARPGRQDADVARDAGAVAGDLARAAWCSRGSPGSGPASGRSRSRLAHPPARCRVGPAPAP